MPCDYRTASGQYMKPLVWFWAPSVTHQGRIVPKRDKNTSRITYLEQQTMQNCGIMFQRASKTTYSTHINKLLNKLPELTLATKNRLEKAVKQKHLPGSFSLSFSPYTISPGLYGSFPLPLLTRNNA